MNYVMNWRLRSEIKERGLYTVVSWTVEEITRLVGGRMVDDNDAETEVTGVSFDTRTLSKGDLFVPIVSERDGHEFVYKAIENGAKATLWSNKSLPLPKNIAVILVEDSFKALQRFAKNYLEYINPIKVAITGSNGKTTTKDMTASVLSQKYITHKTDGNYNNQIGLPITILRMPKDTEAIVLEMGMDEQGQIEELSTLVEPDISAITMVGESHIENFGSREKIADAKMEITKGLKKEGYLVYFGDEKLLQERVDDSQYQLKSFGQQTTNEIYPTWVNSHMKSTEFKVNLDERLAFQIPTPGVYNVNNALVAIQIGLVAGLTLNQINEGLKSFQLTKNRLEWIKGIHQSTILNDAYNASPSSMKAVLKYFSSLKPVDDGQKLVILGDIRELGEHSPQLHVSLKEEIENGDFSEVILYGPQMNYLYKALQVSKKVKHLSHFEGNKVNLVDYVQRIISKNDYILVKSSYGTDLLSLIDYIKE